MGSEYIKAEEYLIKGSRIKSSQLKEKLLKEGYKENKCEICGLTEWMGKHIVCQLHHIDGDNTNNTIENLQILCPNCHSQTDTYCGNSNATGVIYTCEKCGKKITKGARYCEEYYYFTCRKVDRPTKEQLIEDLNKLHSFVKVSKKYGVSDSTIRKWAKTYKIVK